MERPTWAPPGIDIDLPSPARVYDYFLGGSHNFAADRALGDQLIAAAPDTRPMTYANRAFLHRAVDFLVDADIRQFLDLGSGIPSRGNVHEIAQQTAPEARIVYVDLDPVAVAHSQAILAHNDRARAIQLDLRQPQTVLGHPDLRGLLDLTQPTALLLVSVLHFVPEAADPAAIIAQYTEALAPGSYVVISHLTSETNPQQMAAGERVAQRAAMPATIRSRAAITSLFNGLGVVEPGVVWAPQWRPAPGTDTSDAQRSSFLVGVAQKP